MLAHVTSIDMSRFLSSVSRDSQFVHMSLEPLDLDGARPVPSVLAKKIEDVEEFAQRGPPVTLSALPAFVDAAKNLSTVGIDDRKLFLEKLLTLMSRLPDDSVFAAKLQQFVIDILYKDLPHPPSSYLALPTPTSSPVTRVSAENVRYAFRSADGSNYNPLFPTMGQARSPYARSVPSSSFIPISALPDPGLVFDTLLRRDQFMPHPGGISSLFFAFANLIIHSVFNTDHKDFTVNNASSYLDLSILYGSSDQEMDSVRRKDGTGMLYDDVFADSRLLLTPPSVCALLILFNRNHNYVAQKILDINEWGTYKKPVPTDDRKRIAQDDEIFHRSRLVNCGLFMQIILGDYVGALLGLARDGLSWRLNPLETFRELGHEFSPQGQGNVVSLEFNLLYRWHACVSEQDTKWTEAEFNSIFRGKDFSTLSVQDFMKAAERSMVPPGDVKQWKFGNLTRNDAGRFDDGALAKILQNATEWSAGAFRARGTPEVLRVIEILGIEQARSWGTCSLNEFRKFIGLKPYSSFKEWNPDQNIYTAAEALYTDIENLELHVGLQAEETKKPTPGAGLCPGYTISRAILADAVCLTRGDRFLTVNFTPFNFTSWGYQDCQYDKNDGSYGGMLTKLLFRTLPDYYPARSAYAHFPFLVPGYIKDHLAMLPNSSVDKYIWSRPPPPSGSVIASSYQDVGMVLVDKDTFRSAYDKKIKNITNNVILYKRIVQKLVFSDQHIRTWVHTFQYTTNILVKEKSVDHVGSSLKYVDIVKDVINMLPIYWIADEIVGLEMKTKSNPRGIYRDQELYEQFANVCNYIFINSDPVHDWTLRESAGKTTEHITERIKGHLSRLSGSILSVNGFSDSLIGYWAGRNNSDTFLKQLLAARRTHPTDQIAASLFSEVIPTAALYSKAIAHVVNFYLDETQTEARQDIAQLSTLRTPESEARILSYVREALRLDPLVSGAIRIADVDAKLSSGKEVRKGEQVVVCVAEANLDKNVFGPDPRTAVYNRTPVENTGILGVEPYGLLSPKFFENTVTPVLGTIFGLKGLRRVPGQSGQFNRFTQQSHYGFQEQVYISSRGQISPWPASLVVQYTV